MAVKTDDFTSLAYVSSLEPNVAQVRNSITKKDTNGLVSAIIPTYNSGHHIVECVESVLSQTYPHIEIIVVDDGSTDGTQAILFPYVSQQKIRYLRQPNQGPAAARNLAIRNSNGDFIAFVDADDVWLPEKLERQLAIFRNRDNVGLVYSDGKSIGEKWEMLTKTSRRMREYEKRKAELYLRGQVYKGLLNSNFILTSSVVVRRNVLEKTGLFLEKMYARRFSYGEDFELWLRIARVSEIDFVPQELVERRLHVNQLTHDKRNGYRQLCSLYQYLFFQNGSTEKHVIARKYLENVMKRMIAGVLGQRACNYLAEIRGHVV